MTTITIQNLRGSKSTVTKGDRVMFKNDTFRISRIDGFRVYLEDEDTQDELIRPASISELLAF